MKIKYFVPLYSLIFSFFAINCSDNNPISPLEPGSRSYEWKEFNLNSNAPMNHYSKLWGLSPGKIWLVGGAGDYDKTILKYNGIQVAVYGQLSVNPTSIFGLAENEFWIAGVDFDFWKYNGTVIRKYASYPITGCSMFFAGISGVKLWMIFMRLEALVMTVLVS